MNTSTCLYINHIEVDGLLQLTEKRGLEFLSKSYLYMNYFSIRCPCKHLLGAEIFHAIVTLHLDLMDIQAACISTRKWWCQWLKMFGIKLRLYLNITSESKEIKQDVALNTMWRNKLMRHLLQHLKMSLLITPSYNWRMLPLKTHYSDWWQEIYVLIHSYKVLYKWCIVMLYLFRTLICCIHCKHC